MFKSMPGLASFTLFLIAMSLGAVYATFLFTFYPHLYLELDGILSIDFGVQTNIISLLEGEINIIDDWIVEHRKIFGPALLLFSLYNLIRLISIYFIG